MKRLMIMLLFGLFNNQIWASQLGLKGKIKIVGQIYNFKASDNRLKLYDEKKELHFLIIIDKKNKDDSQIIYVNNIEKFYIPITKKEINSISNIKNFLIPKSKEKKEYNIQDKNNIKKILNFNFKEYSSLNELGKVNLFLSKEINNYLEKFISYENFINFLKDTDFSGIPFIDNYFDLIKYFVIQSSKLGFIGEMHLNEENIYSLETLKEYSVKEEEFKIPNKYNKKGLEKFIENF